jgi:hypothetical protein
VRPEASWDSYPADVAMAERAECCVTGCGAAGELVRVQTGSVLLPFGDNSTSTTVWCQQHAQENGYVPPAPDDEPRQPRLNAFQRWIVRELGGSAPRSD